MRDRPPPSWSINPSLPSGGASDDAPRPKIARTRLRVEQLEDRVLPSLTPLADNRLLHTPSARVPAAVVASDHQDHSSAFGDDGSIAGASRVGRTPGTPWWLDGVADESGDFVYRATEPGMLVLGMDGDDFRLLDGDTGAEIARRPAASTDAVVIYGVDDADDTLTIDFDSGLPSAPVTFHGGPSGYDTLVLKGGHFATASYGADNKDSGTLRLDETIVHFTGLEPIDETGLTVDARVFNAPDDDPDTADQQIR